MEKNQKYHRLEKRYSKASLLVVAVVLSACFLTIGFLWKSARPQFRKTFVVMGDPVAIISWDTRGKEVTVLTIDSETVIPGVYGVGNYSLDALWRLGLIDGKKENLLSQSLAEAFAIPISWYIGPGDERLTDGISGLPILRRTFALSQLAVMLRGQLRTNMPFGTYASLFWLSRWLRPDQVTTLDATRFPVTTQVELPDGSMVKQLDTERVDTFLDAHFEERDIRQEALSVAIYNTTAAAALGGRVGKLLGHIGALVVSVANEPHAIDRCQLSASSSLLQSRTVRFIGAYYGCSVYESEENSRADIVVKIGRSFEAIFQPRGN